ncbi:4-hydroxybenzoate octaprenyltransferase [Inquilinus sp. CAU 1745]|uniref:4-hydroxybenzoate octaprenyltransferase n=1 Tax=Inquilinus sp. CAU 1745 TaxID=3140369 RepID=UPI00325C2723
MMTNDDTGESRSGHTDIVSGGWIERFAPGWVEPYLKLARLDRPIGTWLLLIPCWLGMALAGSFDPWLVLLFTVGAVVMRGAGCTINDLFDRDIDGRVERTRGRPIPSGRVSVLQALLFLAALLAVGLLILLQFNGATILAGVVSLLLVVPYPLMKRITWWPQLFLGFTFNWGALMGWTAATGSLSWPAVALYAGGIFWTLGYDTIYAHQDKEDDALVGVKSSARRLGEMSKPAIHAFHVIATLLILAAGFGAGLSAWFAAGPLLALAFVVREVAVWRLDDPADCLRRFKRSKTFGFLVLAGLALGHLL